MRIMFESVINIWNILAGSGNRVEVPLMELPTKPVVMPMEPKAIKFMKKVEK